MINKIKNNAFSVAKHNLITVDDKSVANIPKCHHVKLPNKLGLYHDWHHQHITWRDQILKFMEKQKR